MKKNEGFTLVELLVSFAVGAIVALAATSVLLLGLRFNSISGGTAQRQNTTRILLTVFENLATEGKIGTVKDNYDSWEIWEANTYTVLLSYDSETQAIYSGKFASTSDESSENPEYSVLLDGVRSSHVELEGNLLSFYVETKDGSYSSSVYCRNVPKKEEKVSLDKTVDTIIESLKKGEKPNAIASISDARLLFLQVLTKEIGSTGKILNGTDAGKYYSQYCNSSWPSDTPWCGCFLYWAAQQTQSKLSSSPDWAYMDKFIRLLSIKGYGEEGFYPIPGDAIFFDWDGDKDPEHVGVVLYVDTDTHTIYTIEGNSAGIVAVRKYQANDNRIIGYGVLPWTNANS